MAGLNLVRHLSQIKFMNVVAFFSWKQTHYFVAKYGLYLYCLVNYVTH